MPNAETLPVEQFIKGMIGLKSLCRADTRNRRTLEKNFRVKYEALDHVRLTDAGFDRPLLDIATLDVFIAARILRGMNGFTRVDGAPLSCTLVNIADSCKNTSEVVNRLLINTDHSYRPHDVVPLIKGIACAQIELKTLGINPRRAMEQSVEYKNALGNGYGSGSRRPANTFEDDLASRRCG